MLAMPPPDVDDTNRRATPAGGPFSPMAQIFRIAADKCEQPHRIHWTIIFMVAGRTPHPMIACVIHGAEELKTENHSKSHPEDGEVFGAV
jgi:hypothetical protein